MQTLIDLFLAFILCLWRRTHFCNLYVPDCITLKNVKYKLLEKRKDKEMGEKKIIKVVSHFKIFRKEAKEAKTDIYRNWKLRKRQLP